MVEVDPHHTRDGVGAELDDRPAARRGDRRAEVDGAGQSESARVVGVVADQVDSTRCVGAHHDFVGHRVARRSAAARAGSTGLNQTPLPSSPAATKRWRPGARSNGAM
jgi:hypothetical protein